MSATYCEASAVNRLCKVFVEVGIKAFECGAVKAVRNYAGVAYNILTASKFFHGLPLHFLFNAGADCVRLCLDLCGKFIIVVHCFNKVHHFVSCHCYNLLYSSFSGLSDFRCLMPLQLIAFTE